MERASYIENKKQNTIPKGLAWIGGALIVIYGLVLGLYGLVVGAQIFSISVPTGLIMMFTAIGWIVFIPAYTAFSSLGWFEGLSSVDNKYEFWFKTIAYFVGAFVIPLIVYIIASFVALAIAGFIAGIID
jgi:hypothetical protein